MSQQSLSSLDREMPLAQLILSGLQERQMSGRDLLRFLAEAHSASLEPGTLLATLRRLEHAGWVFCAGIDPRGARGPRYGVTDAGVQALSQGGSVLFAPGDRVRAPIFTGMFAGVLLMVIKWILRLYPLAWRARYEEEMLELLGSHQITLWTWLDLLWNALDARLDPFYRRSASLAPFRRAKYVQRVILLAFLLPLFSALFYFRLFSFGSGLRNEYWTRNQQYPILAVTDGLGSLGITVALFCALLACIHLAYQGIKRFGKPGDKPVHRLILIGMYLPGVIILLASSSSHLIPEEVSEPLLVGSVLFITLLLIGWGLVRWEAFKRAFLHLLPWLAFHLTMLMTVLGQLTYTPPPDDAPSPTVFGLHSLSALIAVLIMLTIPFSFVALMAWLRLNHQARSVLLTVTTVETLGITLVHLMMFSRLIALQVLGLDTIWTSELAIELSLNVLCTAVALGYLLTLLPRSRSNTPPTAPVEERGVVPLA